MLRLGSVSVGKKREKRKVVVNAKGKRSKRWARRRVVRVRVAKNDRRGK